MPRFGILAVDELLAAVPNPTPLPPAERRRQLRDELGLSRTQVARNRLNRHGRGTPVDFHPLNQSQVRGRGDVL
ncbi:hypothetical protein [Streptomyces sp. AS02]|uniref:hypothetical protein n=1 Tax=Streptomyces sp. AS02 TaxID=2938946 RepID=UPI0020216F97|nr:hypothetical protein [Streptomyces sp. AS02]MCL8017931.1 hypothetical protein [Streptomyces sp. AS02]